MGHALQSSNLRGRPLSVRESLTVDRFNDGKAPLEIAESFGISRWGVYKRLERARRKCAEAVARRQRSTFRVEQFANCRIRPRSLSNFVI
jgi:hypothetical protein